ncbi:MAG: trypsin-like peptidase domain-containing protein [Roseburia sp.]|nr:trypsin-like peptidase domain-containing protein [Roseburia sp.]MCM1099029.1 trypsin-like peptidase domain-containing protein [Ruminococcus flavefaciens]
MYENEIYSETNITKPAEGEGGASPYFDYTARSAEELSRAAAGSAEGKKEKKKRQKKEPGQRMGTGKKVLLSIGLGLCFGVFAGLGFYAVQLGTGQLKQTNGSGNVVQELPSDIVREPWEGGEPTTYHVTYVQDDISEMVEDVMPAMVSIVNNSVVTGRDWFGQTYTQPSVGSGSGIIVGETEDELLIATNYHVVENNTSLEITFIDNSTAEAKVKGVDSDMDLAVISVPLAELEKETRSAITVAQLGDSDNLKLGTPVVAIGNALGYGQSVTNGIVSALNREMTTEDGSTGIYIQTNAAINHGNSGGALLNIRGEVIGINAARIDGSTVEGMGYAIPINAASPILSELMERETRTDKVDAAEVGYMGITMQAVTDDIVSMLDIPKGVFVREVAPGSPAEAAGVLKGDIIVKLDGQRITVNSDVKDTLEYFRAGETITMTVKRSVNGEYETLELEIVLGKKPAE